MATYGLKFYKDIQGFNAFDGRRYPVSLKIYEKNYNGATVEIDALAANSLKISYGNSGDRRYEPIKKTSIDFAIIDTEQFDYTQFYTSDATKFKVEVDALGFKNVGFIVQDSFSRSLSYKAAINLTAIDNLSILDDIKFKDLKLPKYCRIDQIIMACIERCNPNSYVRFTGENMYYYGEKQVYPNPIKSLRYHRLTINTRSLLDKDLKEVLEMLLLSGMSYIYQSGTGYIVREYTSDYSATKLLQRKITAQFEGESELTMTPAVRNFTLTNELNNYNVMGDYTPKNSSYYERIKGSERYLLKGWEHTAGSILGAISHDGQQMIINSSGLVAKLQDSLDVQGYSLLVVPAAEYKADEMFSTAEVGVLPSYFSLIVNLKTQYTYLRNRNSETMQLRNISMRFALYYIENGITYYYDNNKNIFTPAFSLSVITADNVQGEISISVNVSGLNNSADKIFYLSLYTPMSSDREVMDRYTGSGFTVIPSIEITNTSKSYIYNENLVKIKVGDNNTDLDEEVAFSSSPHTERGCILDYDNLLISTLNFETDVIQYIRPEESLQLPDMLLMEYQARACLFLTEAPAKKINGGLFLDTSNMLNQDQTTRADTFFDFVISSKYGDYRMNQAEINLLDFSVDGEFCEVREFYTSDYVANEPIINTFIQKNYLKHS